MILVVADTDPLRYLLEIGHISLLPQLFERIFIPCSCAMNCTIRARRACRVTGTLGFLTRSARRGLIDLADALTRLKRTNFHYRQELFDDLLKKYAPGS